MGYDYIDNLITILFNIQEMRRRFVSNFLSKYNNSNEKQILNALIKYYQKNQLISGFCTPEGSQKFSKMQHNVHASNWRQPKYINQKLKLSSLGIGTQLGAPSNQIDKKMFAVLFQALKSRKINVIDTDINFRYGKSQKTINAVINYLQKQHNISRDSLFIATKCGYIPNDIDSQLDGDKFVQKIVQEYNFNRDDIVNDIHCLSPSFIEICTAKSQLSLGVQTIDLMYLNNPTEMQLAALGKDKYFDKLSRAFQCLEELRSANQIRYYGIASALSFRCPPDEQAVHANLSQIVELAEKIGGNNHGMRFVLIPFNLAMPQVVLKWQVSKDKIEQDIFKIAKDSRVNINFCGPLYQGKVTNLPFKGQFVKNIKNISAKHLQLIRSYPKQTVLNTVFSTLNVDHLKQNLEVVNHSYLTQEQWKKILPT